MRLFISLDLEELKDYFNEIQKQIPSDIAKFKLVDSFHLTLKFLGETDKVEEIKAALSKISFKPIKLKLDKLGLFPSESYIRVIWIGLKDDHSLINLQKDVENVLEPFHFRKDFEFVPHLTLARVKFIKDKKAFQDKLKAIKIEQKEVALKEFKLIKSTLTEEGPIYEDLERFEAK